MPFLKAGHALDETLSLWSAQRYTHTQTHPDPSEDGSAESVLSDPSKFADTVPDIRCTVTTLTGSPCPFLVCSCVRPVSRVHASQGALHFAKLLLFRMALG